MSLVADCMIEEHAPNNSKAREIVDIFVLFSFTSVRVAGFKGGNYKPIDKRMLNRSTKCRPTLGMKRIFKNPVP